MFPIFGVPDLKSGSASATAFPSGLSRKLTRNSQYVQLLLKILQPLCFIMTCEDPVRAKYRASSGPREMSRLGPSEKSRLQSSRPDIVTIRYGEESQEA